VWHEAHVGLGGWCTVALVGPGGAPWQPLQASFPVAVQATVFAPFPPVKFPWQYVDAQVWLVKLYAAGVAPPTVARPENVTATVPFECPVEVGTAWQLEHASAFDSGPGAAPSPWFTCARCAPVAVAPPPASAGGEDRTSGAPSASSALADATGVRAPSP
jgi:hypothetical protein